MGCSNGGSQVGPFTASTNFQSDFTVTNWDSVTAIDRSQPLTFNWTGSGFDQVVILATTATVIGANQHLPVCKYAFGRDDIAAKQHR